MSSRKIRDTLAIPDLKARGRSVTESGSARERAEISALDVTADPTAVSERIASAPNENARQPTVADRQAAMEVAKRIMRENEDVLAALAK